VGVIELILDRAILAFLRSSCPLHPMVAVLDILVVFRSRGTQGELLTGDRLLEVAEANPFPARSVICDTHFLTPGDICLVYHPRN
jgi:hypothetical protein